MIEYVFLMTPLAFSRVVRRVIDSGTGLTVSELVLVDRIPACRAGRNGGAMALGCDGSLYVAIGDAGCPGQAQNLASYAGKIIRVCAETQKPEIWARGLRDPQRLEFDALGRLLVTERAEDGTENPRLVWRGANLAASFAVVSPRVQRLLTGSFTAVGNYGGPPNNFDTLPSPASVKETSDGGRR